MPSPSELERERQEAEDLGGNAAQELKRYCERIEKLEQERKEIGLDIKDVRSEAKANGFDVRTLNQMLAERRLDTEVRQARYALQETYRRALGLSD